MNVKAHHGAFYFLNFIDDYSRYAYMYLLAHRYKALDVFKCFVTEVETQLDRRLKTLRIECFHEYLPLMLKDFCEEQGIRRQLTIPSTAQQNAMVERKNRTLLHMVSSMMTHANLLMNFWRDASLTAIYILNRGPSKSIPPTPYELWHGRKPSLAHLHPWG